MLTFLSNQLYFIDGLVKYNLKILRIYMYVFVKKKLCSENNFLCIKCLLYEV